MFDWDFRKWYLGSLKSFKWPERIRSESQQNRPCILCCCSVASFCGLFDGHNQTQNTGLNEIHRFFTKFLVILGVLIWLKCVFPLFVSFRLLTAVTVVADLTIKNPLNVDQFLGYLHIGAPTTVLYFRFISESKYVSIEALPAHMSIDLWKDSISESKYGQWLRYARWDEVCSWLSNSFRATLYVLLCIAS